MSFKWFCQVGYLYEDTGTRDSCGEHPAWLIVTACVHEHVTNGAACREHGELYRDIPCEMICGPCVDGPQSHQCPVLVVTMTECEQEEKENRNE